MKSVRLHFFAPADPRTRREQTGEEPDSENNSERAIRITAHKLIGRSRAGDGSFLQPARADLEQLFAVMHDGLDVLEKFIQIHVLSVPGFVSHDTNNGEPHREAKWGVRPAVTTSFLIGSINPAKIVKNFTNFACGSGAAPITFRRIIKRLNSADISRVSRRM